MAVDLLDELAKDIKPGVTTHQLDARARELYAAAGAQPATLSYGDPPFPGSICTSLNDVICHGIPDDRPLVEGDILNIDTSPIVDGYIGDHSRMYQIGQVDADKALVSYVAYKSLQAALGTVAPNASLSAIGTAIEEYATAHGCSVVYKYVGHGVGLQFHEPPYVRHYRNDIDIPLAAGMIFTIEPMINRGVPDAISDGSLFIYLDKYFFSCKVCSYRIGRSGISGV